MTRKTTWSERPDVPGAVKTHSLRKGLLWTFGVIQVTYVAWFLVVYIRAEVAKNGDPLHDLGVTFAREVVLDDLQGLWLVTTVITAACFIALYFYLKDRWGR
jgi:uncharacterized BrkB/YihY/UPF0761 family membrane protein